MHVFFFSCKSSGFHFNVLDMQLFSFSQRFNSFQIPILSVWKPSGLILKNFTPISTCSQFFYFNFLAPFFYILLLVQTAPILLLHTDLFFLALFTFATLFVLIQTASSLPLLNFFVLPLFFANAKYNFFFILS